MHDVSFRGVRTWQRSQRDVATCRRGDRARADKSPRLGDEDRCFDVAPETLSSSWLGGQRLATCCRLHVRVWDKMFHRVLEQLAPPVRRPRQTNDRDHDRLSQETGDLQDPRWAAFSCHQTLACYYPRRNLRNILNRPVNHRGGISALLSPRQTQPRMPP